MSSPHTNPACADRTSLERDPNDPPIKTSDIMDVVRDEYNRMNTPELEDYTRERRLELKQAKELKSHGVHKVQLNSYNDARASIEHVKPEVSTRWMAPMAS